MKKRYLTPAATTVTMNIESIICLSYGGNGDGRPAESPEKEYNADDSWTDYSED